MLNIRTPESEAAIAVDKLLSFVARVAFLQDDALHLVQEYLEKEEINLSDAEKDFVSAAIALIKWHKEHPDGF